MDPEKASVQHALERAPLARTIVEPPKPKRFRLLAFFALGLYGCLHLLYTSPRSPLSPRYIHVPPLSPDFVARCHELLDAPSHTFTDRLSRLSHVLSSPHPAEGVTAVTARSKGAAWIAEPGASAFYFFGGFGPTSWHPSERPLLLAVYPGEDGKPKLTILTPRFEELRARGKPLPDGVADQVEWLSWQENISPYERLWQHLEDKVDGVVFDGQVRDFIATGVRRAIGPKEGVERQQEQLELERSIGLLRQRKDEREVGLLRCANQFTLQAIRETRRKMYMGISESQTREILDKEISKTGLDGEGGLILFGENAALPHGSGTDKKLGKHDLALIDVGGVWGGYVADITRTFALPDSRISEKYIDIWETVRQAQYAPYKLLLQSNASHPPKLSELDVAARAVITGSSSEIELVGGTPDFSSFTHRLGHGIGLEGHEAPYLVQGPLGETRAQSGHTFSLEPGIYLPRGGGQKRDGLDGLGVRLEDCFVVTEDAQGQLGGEWLSGPVKKWGDV